MRTGLATHALALRKPVEVDPLTFDPVKGTAGVDYSFNAPPAIDKVMVEIAVVEGMPEHAIEPQKFMPADDETMYLRFGKAPPHVLSMKIDTAMRTGVQARINLDATLNYKLDYMPKDERYSPKDKAVTTHKQQVQFAHQQAASFVEGATKKLQTAKGKEKTDLSQAILRTQEQLNRANAALEQFAALETQYAALGAGGIIHFRVYFEAGEEQVDLIRSNSLPPPPRAPANKPAPAAAPARAAATPAK
jgi:hypothetical protein